MKHAASWIKRQWGFGPFFALSTALLAARTIQEEVNQ